MTILNQVPVSDSIAWSQIQKQLQVLLLGEAGALVLGTIIFIVGLSAMLVYCVRPKPRAGLLLWFGLIALLYGVRLLATLDTVHLLIGLPEISWRYLIPFINYLILIPFVLFIEETYGRGWKSSLRGLFWIQTLYAVAAILADSIRRAPESSPDPVYLFFFGLTFILLLGRFFNYQPPMFEESRAIYIALFVFILFVANEHLVTLRLVPWSLRLEAIGFFLFVLLLGCISVRRFLLNEQRLAALQHEMDAAWQIQASILPRTLPTLEGCRLAVRYVPMASVAGDYYDFVTVDNTHLGILIADVAGHGVPAALIASMVKVALSSQCMCVSDPAAVVSGLNQVLCRQETGQFVTAGYLLLDLKNATGLYSGAAHPPLLLWRSADGKIQEIHENGLPLGFRPNEQYSNVPIHLIPGDRLLMYTDGIIDAASPSGDFFGEQSFKEFIKNHSPLTGDRFADLLLQDLTIWSGRKAGRTQEDDLTLIIVDIV
jgi:sigma-B regulation protein RsbU (phosphoserine phosphatase)